MLFKFLALVIRKELYLLTVKYSNLHYIRDITPKRVASGEIHLRSSACAWAKQLRRNVAAVTVQSEVYKVVKKSTYVKVLLLTQKWRSSRSTVKVRRGISH